MAYVVDENGNAKTTLNVVVLTLQDKLAEGMDAISLINGGVMYIPKLDEGPRVLPPESLIAY